MELKKDSNAVAIDMLLIVHSEKRRAAQTTQLDSQEDPSALLQNRGGNARLAQVLLRSRGTITTRPRGLPAGGRPERGQSKPPPPPLLVPGRHSTGVPRQRAAAAAAPWLSQVDSPCRPMGALSYQKPVSSRYSLKYVNHVGKRSAGKSQGLRRITCCRGLVPRTACCTP